MIVADIISHSPSSTDYWGWSDVLDLTTPLIPFSVERLHVINENSFCDHNLILFETINLKQKKPFRTLRTLTGNYSQKLLEI